MAFLDLLGEVTFELGWEGHALALMLRGADSTRVQSGAPEGAVTGRR